MKALKQIGIWGPWALLLLSLVVVIFGPAIDGEDEGSKEDTKPPVVVEVDVKSWIEDIDTPHRDGKEAVADILRSVADRSETGELMTTSDMSEAILAGMRQMPDVMDALEWSGDFNGDVRAYFAKLKADGLVDETAKSHAKYLREIARQLDEL